VIRLEEINVAARRAYYGQVYLGDICREVDGDWVFYPDLKNGGCWTEHLLTAIAEKLAFLNMV
jgi:hypothetical protein